ncbi:MAG: hypothetical protein U9N04_03390 [Patescibacteria group bacterium]|nr:hypothetical protein [Patescibacteria group bacterium]
MEEKKSAKSLLEMDCVEVEEIIRRRKDDRDYPVSQIQFGRLAKHCLNCDKCRVKATKVGFLVANKS